jgi:16S rRNA (cytidine1402-2'-O)-methyltransferase
MDPILGDRQLVVARELTKAHEEFLRGTPAELVTHFRAHPARGEITVVVAGSQWKQKTDD